MFPKEHSFYEDGAKIAAAHTDAKKHFQEVDKHTKAIMNHFKQWEQKFGDLEKIIKERDEAHHKYYHYVDKLPEMQKKKSVAKAEDLVKINE